MSSEYLSSTLCQFLRWFAVVGITVVVATACAPPSSFEEFDPSVAGQRPLGVSKEALGEVVDGAGLANWDTTLDVCFYNGSATDRATMQTVVTNGWGQSVSLNITWSGTCPNPVGANQIPVFMYPIGGNVGKSGKGERFPTGYWPSWQSSHAYAVGDFIKSGVHTYRCVHSGVSGTLPITGVGTSIVDGSVLWDWKETCTSSDWQPSTSYLVGNMVTANGLTYTCDVAGVSSGVGTGPSGFAQNIGDGTARWDFATPISLIGLKDCYAWRHVWNRDPNFGFKPLQIAVDVEDYAFLHEFGHVLGFVHEPLGSRYTLPDSDRSVMSYSSPRPPTLSDLDRLGAEIAYPSSFVRSVEVGPGVAFLTGTNMLVRADADFRTDWTRRGADDAVFGTASIRWKVNTIDTLFGARLPIAGAWVSGASTIAASFTDFRDTGQGGRFHSGSLTLTKPLAVSTGLHTAIVSAVELVDL